MAREKGWRTLKRSEQVNGLRNWVYRGLGQDATARPMVTNDGQQRTLCGIEGLSWTQQDAEACLRCWPSGYQIPEKGDDDILRTDEGTIGFFVVGFVRDRDCDASSADGSVVPGRDQEFHDLESEHEEWEGLTD
jgi:putative methyltransferase